MGLGFFAVLIGSFLMAVASVRSEHALWRRLGNAAGRANETIRWVAATVGFGPSGLMKPTRSYFLRAMYIKERLVVVLPLF